jgi:hypothetical protein
MELKDRIYLKEHYNNYETSQSGYLRNLDLSIMKTYESIYRKYIDPNFILTIWCGNCRMDMVVRLYKYYESLPIENLIMGKSEKGEKSEVIENQQIVEPKKRGRKPKTNG